MKILNQRKPQPIKFSTTILLLLVFTLWNTKAQDVKIENISSDLDALSVNTNNEWNKIGSDAVNQYLDEMKNLFYFEIKYKDQVVYRESIKKSVPEKSDTQFFSNKQRFELKRIYIDPTLIDDSDKLLLLESYRNTIKEIGGKKLLVLTNLRILQGKSGEYQIINPIDDMKINFYKIKF